MRRQFVTAVAVAFFVVAGIIASQITYGQAFVNGSFEADNWSNGPNYMPDVDGANGPITGWSAFDNGVGPDYLIGVNDSAAYGNTPHGSQYLVLGPLGMGGNYVTQTITGFMSNTVYELHFSQSSGFVGSILEIAIEGDTFPQDNFSAGSPTSTAPFDTWDDFTIPFFVETGPTITFTFLDFGSTPCIGCLAPDDVGLDDIYITGPGIGVPEPGALAMFLGTATSGAGLLLRRRSSRAEVG